MVFVLDLWQFRPIDLVHIASCLTTGVEMNAASDFARWPLCEALLRLQIKSAQYRKRQRSNGTTREIVTEIPQETSAIWKQTEEYMILALGAYMILACQNCKNKKKKLVERNDLSNHLRRRYQMTSIEMSTGRTGEDD